MAHCKISSVPFVFCPIIRSYIEWRLVKQTRDLDPSKSSPALVTFYAFGLWISMPIYVKHLPLTSMTSNFSHLGSVETNWKD